MPTPTSRTAATVSFPLLPRHQLAYRYKSIALPTLQDGFLTKAFRTPFLNTLPPCFTCSNSTRSRTPPVATPSLTDSLARAKTSTKSSASPTRSSVILTHPFLPHRPLPRPRNQTGNSPLCLEKRQKQPDFVWKNGRKQPILFGKTA